MDVTCKWCGDAIKRRGRTWYDDYVAPTFCSESPLRADNDELFTQIMKSTRVDMKTIPHRGQFPHVPDIDELSLLVLESQEFQKSLGESSSNSSA